MGNTTLTANMRETCCREFAGLRVAADIVKYCNDYKNNVVGRIAPVNEEEDDLTEKTYSLKKIFEVSYLFCDVRGSPYGRRTIEIIIEGTDKKAQDFAKGLQKVMDMSRKVNPGYYHGSECFDD